VLFDSDFSFDEDETNFALLTPENRTRTITDLENIIQKSGFRPEFTKPHGIYGGIIALVEAFPVENINAAEMVAKIMSWLESEDEAISY
jgi:hypothetical protein